MKEIATMIKETGISEEKIRKAIALDMFAKRLAETKDIITVKEFLRTHRTSNGQSGKEKIIFRRWSELVSTKKEAKELYNNVPNGSIEESFAIIKIAEMYGYQSVC